MLASEYEASALEAADNKISIVLSEVRMPFSTQPVANAIVENFELMQPRGEASNNKVFSLLDTNKNDPGTS